jgi:riboflavin kinase/FMN adenylyltransferase
MLQFDGVQPLPPQLKGAVGAIGNFDGMHRGHQELLQVAKAAAAVTGKAWGLVTFEPHPRTFFKPDEPVFRLTPTPLKAQLATALGAGFMVNLAFNHALSLLDPAEFVARYLVDYLGVSHVITGYDFHFGRGRKGNPDTLRNLGAAHGFAVTIVDQVADDDEGHAPFSSSSIRSSLRRGHVVMAARELGYRWMVMGEVVRGDQRGRSIGFPTLNIVLEPGAEPFRGVYAVEVRDPAQPGAAAWAGAGYFGDRPTFNTTRTFLEVYLLDVSADLYGRTLMVEFVDLIRPDQRFAGVAELVQQMHADCARARTILQEADKGEQGRIRDLPLRALQAQGRL